MQNPYTYFETKPTGGFLDDATYEKSSRTLGRMCLDIGFIVNKKVVFFERSLEPMKGLWLTGGRIRFEQFVDAYSYASLTAQESCTIDVCKNKKTLLRPRFVCFSKRPYPEILIWIMISISKKQFSEIVLNHKEQSNMVMIGTVSELRAYAKKHNYTPLHTSILVDLFEELKREKLI